jgi:hypothetical protein
MGGPVFGPLLLGAYLILGLVLFAMARRAARRR